MCVCVCVCVCVYICVYVYIYVCICLCVCVHAGACSVASIMANSLRPYGLEPPMLSVHGILQARILEWVAVPSSRGPSQSMD